jgi:hypothetical protein
MDRMKKDVAKMKIRRQFCSPLNRRNKTVRSMSLGAILAFAFHGVTSAMDLAIAVAAKMKTIVL